jgi:hypothetical protein
MDLVHRQEKGHCMRLVIGLVAAISIAAGSQVLALDPQQQSPTPAQPAPDSAPAPATVSPSSPDQSGAKPPAADANAATSASATAAANPPVVVKAGKPELTHEEQQLVSRGYKLEMRHGEKWFCRREAVLGSRLQETKVCGTASMLSSNRANQQDEMRSHPYMTPPGH